MGSVALLHIFNKRLAATLWDDGRQNALKCVQWGLRNLSCEVAAKETAALATAHKKPKEGVNTENKTTLI